MLRPLTRINPSLLGGAITSTRPFHLIIIFSSDNFGIKNRSAEVFISEILCYYIEMKYLGIDYGEKRIGLAVSDEESKIAFPLDVLSNDKRLIERIKQICSTEKIGSIVIGESKDFGGKDNIIMKNAKIFFQLLKKKLKLPIHWEIEFYTSAEAARLQGKHGMLDASAAAIILQSYLNKQINIKNKKL